MVQVSVESNLAESHHYPNAAQRREFGIQKVRAVGDLLRIWFVGRRSAAYCRSDVRVGQFQSVITVCGHWLRREARFVEHWIHKVPRPIAGEGTACAIGAVRSRSKSQNENSSVGIAESGHWLCPILPVNVCAAFYAPDLLAIGDKSGA